ncbi:DNA metabolism protein [Lithospermum erythrorhizon]|uniref:DNA metabolism protein n=1 Tax=Lithospermum erythrorhizon TaxID=34254 RepID=A0AAV3PD83_LITER
MKRVAYDMKCDNCMGLPPSPPPLPSLRKPVITDSVTRREIAKYWKLKRMVEEDHFSFAIKAAARLKARTLSENDYKLFEESLSDEDDDQTQKEWENIDPNTKDLIRLGIKNWWTKSKYAYLNQPDIKFTDGPKRRRSSSYIAQLYVCSATGEYIWCI